MMNKNVTFETAISELEGIVQKLEEGNLSLDDSIEVYQRGIELSNFCSKKLDSAERKIMMLVQDEDNNIKEVPFLDKEE